MSKVQGPLYYERTGRKGPLIAFLPPNPMDQACWTYQMQHFSTWFRCMAIDTPGYGRSPSADEGIDAHTIALAFWAAVDEVESDEKVILVGCSGGFRYCLAMRHLRPERVAAVVLCGTGLFPLSPRMSIMIAKYERDRSKQRWRHIFEDFSPAFNATERSRYFAEIFHERDSMLDYETIVRQFKALGVGDPTLPEGSNDKGLPDTWLQSYGPTLLLTGTEDSSHQGAFLLQERIEGSELQILPGAGHACQIEQPWLFDDLMIDFLERQGLMKRSEPAR